jgi:hypothetical protein
MHTKAPRPCARARIHVLGRMDAHGTQRIEAANVIIELEKVKPLIDPEERGPLPIHTHAKLLSRRRLGSS